MVLNAYDSRARACAALNQIKTGLVNRSNLEHREGETVTLYRSFQSLEDACDVMAYEFEKVNAVGSFRKDVVDMLMSRQRSRPHVE